MTRQVKELLKRANFLSDMIYADMSFGDICCDSRESYAKSYREIDRIYERVATLRGFKNYAEMEQVTHYMEYGR